jgi:hypothetical protein
MKRPTDGRDVLLEVISEEYPNLTQDEKLVLVKVVSKYFGLLEKSKIEEVANFVYDNYDTLVKLL